MGKDYRPWLAKNEVPSQGDTIHVKGILIPRLFTFFSSLEATYFFMLERQKAVVDIREQFPIFHLAKTEALCAARNVRPIRKNGYPEPFTIDFLITERINGSEVVRAASIKTAEDAKKAEIKERLAIELLWCREHDIDWYLVDTTRFTRTLLDSLRFIRRWYQAGYATNATLEARFVDAFRMAYRPNSTLSELINVVSRLLRLPTFEAQTIFRFCAWSKAINVDIEKALALNRPVCLIEND
ncbi:hypothetical protein GTP58_13325 [Duganella sp. CY15W]|uniref:TnsA endonuclease N-terminal domain-containing protein n=1 Tax=Duganella sp. CY15W TaxID=2692172 RepID=UPI00136800E4|nr:TnsA endonuclease N-terminal domain-containing protein [Duganella sp. CY15W]MYM29305.1 hypothetical protein [Duganella sp. CY15W]